MTISEKIRNDLKEAMMAKDGVRLTTLRGLISAFTNELVALGRKPQDLLTEEETITVLKRAVKQRKDAIEQFSTGGRHDLADSEKAELSILEAYVPPQMSKEDILKVVQVKQAELGISDKSGAGMLMSVCMKELKGQADGGDVKAVVDSMFA